VSARLVAWLMAGAMTVYLVFAVWRAALLIGDGEPVPVLLGIAVLALPLLGLWVLWRELSFGFATQRLGRELGALGGLPVDDLPRTPSGRVDKAAADARFGVYAEEVQADPDSWQAWYRLGIGYDDARDRKRARSAMRTAIRLHDHPTPRP
jgi:hypothetical protein